MLHNWKNKTILVADDDLINFKLLNYMLKKTGAHIVWARNGEEAVNASTKDTFDAILMDIQMPVMDGKEAAVKIRQINKNIPIIMLSAYPASEMKSLTDQDLSSSILNKPVKAEKLVGTIEKHFNHQGNNTMNGTEAKEIFSTASENSINKARAYSR